MEKRFHQSRQQHGELDDGQLYTPGREDKRRRGLPGSGAKSGISRRQGQRHRQPDRNDECADSSSAIVGNRSSLRARGRSKLWNGTGRYPAMPSCAWCRIGCWRVFKRRDPVFLFVLGHDKYPDEPEHDAESNQENAEPHEPAEGCFRTGVRCIHGHEFQNIDWPLLRLGRIGDHHRRRNDDGFDPPRQNISPQGLPRQSSCLPSSNGFAQLAWSLAFALYTSSA